MSTRRAVPAVLASAFAFIFFGLGNYLGARQNADSEERMAALRAEITLLSATLRTAGTAGRAATRPRCSTSTSRAAIIADVKRELSAEMGLLPLASCGSAAKLRRAQHVRRQGDEQLRHRRLSGKRLLHHRQARRRGARPGRRSRTQAHRTVKLILQRPHSRAGRGLGRRHASRSIRATGPS